ncbi:hypothetical protein MLM_0646 [Mycobacterium lepraemurium]|nr:hypothetical protein MLM_0646 [Mycobacterium lepraemurium]
MPGHSRGLRRSVASIAALATSYAATAAGWLAAALPADTTDTPTPCWSDQIAVTAAPAQGAVGHRAVTLVFTLAGGAEPCTLHRIRRGGLGRRGRAHSRAAHPARIPGRAAGGRRCAAHRHPVDLDAGPGDRRGRRRRRRRAAVPHLHRSARQPARHHRGGDGAGHYRGLRAAGASGSPRSEQRPSPLVGQSTRAGTSPPRRFTP